MTFHTQNIFFQNTPNSSGYPFQYNRLTNIVFFFKKSVLIICDMSYTSCELEPVGLFVFVEVGFYDDCSVAICFYGHQQAFVLLLAQPEKITHGKQSGRNLGYI